MLWATPQTATRGNDNETMARAAAKIKLRAERRVGEMLAAMDKATGGQPYQDNPTGHPKLPVGEEPTLSQIGITKRLAERRVGEMLAAMDKAKPPGDNQYAKVDRSQQSTEAPTLSQIGISKQQSSDWQRVADIPEDEKARRRNAGGDGYG